MIRLFDVTFSRQVTSGQVRMHDSLTGGGNLCPLVEYLFVELFHGGDDDFPLLAGEAD